MHASSRFMLHVCLHACSLVPVFVMVALPLHVVSSSPHALLWPDPSLMIQIGDDSSCSLFYMFRDYDHPESGLMSLLPFCACPSGPGQEPWPLKAMKRP